MTIKNARGMLFLFDVQDSTQKVHDSNRVEQQIFYGLLETTVQSVLTNIDADVTMIKSTGDGYYLFSEDPDACLLLFMELDRAFESVNYRNRPLLIRCGAGFGSITLVGDPIKDLRGDLANVVSRCCSSSDVREMIITDTLHNLLAGSTMISNFDLSLTRIERPQSAKGCENVVMWKVKKKDLLVV